MKNDSSPYKYLLQWYDDGSDPDVAEFKFNKRIACKSKALKSKPSKSKEDRTPAPGFTLTVPTVGSVADHDTKGKRNVQNDNSKEFLAPPPKFLIRVPTVRSSAEYESKGKKSLEVTSDQTI
ncbi:hypothetical protein Tco_0651778 [Tanacetum coccineum]|uniref:Uncharacterized protein n=1 Tax=Tanacetum coccineum TaxID=301880 RepID=A0ABQ4WVQ9_9ASTR